MRLRCVQNIIESRRNEEVSALASALGVDDVVWRDPAGGNRLSPLWYVDLPSDEVACQIAERSMLVKVSACYYALSIT